MAEFRLRTEIDRSGVGEVKRVVLNDVLVWSWAAHIDGAMSDDAAELWRALHDSPVPPRPKGMPTTPMGMPIYPHPAASERGSDG